MTDRGYEPDWDLDREEGERNESLIQRLRNGLLSETIEAKIDRISPSTGNVFIEMMCNQANGWQPSGLQKTKANGWAFTLGETVKTAGAVIVVPTERMRAFAMPLWEQGKYVKEMKPTRGSHPTRGIVVPLAMFIKEVVMAPPAVEPEPLPEPVPVPEPEAPEWFTNARDDGKPIHAEDAFTMPLNQLRDSEWASASPDVVEQARERGAYPPR